MKKISINRRLFLFKTLNYTMLLSLGTSFHKVLGMFTSNLRNQTMPITKQNDSEGVFPFTPFITRYNIGEFIPKDQGGKFIQMELFNSEDDEVIVENIRCGLINQHYGNPINPINWIKFEKTELEKSVWINRFYFLPSFARLYFLNKDSSLIDEMMAILKQWITDNPADGSNKSRYNWNDMQVAWRAINFSWCYYLTKDGMDDSDRSVILELQKKHAEILLNDFGKQPLNEFNHQSHGALAMLYLGTLFPSLTDADLLVKTSQKILNHHISNAFYNDGGNVEKMFGYYPFIIHVFRDYELLCRSNNIFLPKANQVLLKKMANYLIQVAQPDNTVPPINDSYEETVVPVLGTLKETINGYSENNKPSSSYFPESQFAVMRENKDPNRSWYVNMNPASLIGAHSHAGRLAVNFWYNMSPVFVECGCCSYDNFELVTWYRTSRAHNTVIIDGAMDKATSESNLWAPKRFTDNRIINWQVNQNFKFCRMFSPSSELTNAQVSWIRDTILVRNDYLIIHDCFKCDSFHDFETLFHIDHSHKTKLRKDKIILIKSKETLAVIPSGLIMTKNISIDNSIQSSKGKSVSAPLISYKFNGEGTINMVYMIKPLIDIKELHGLKLTEEYLENKFVLKVMNESNYTDSLTFYSMNSEKHFGFQSNINI